MLERKANDVPEPFKSWSFVVGCTHLTGQPFCYDDLDATIALTSVPVTLLEDLRVEGREA
jgi:hypothetical protein